MRSPPSTSHAGMLVSALLAASLIAVLLALLGFLAISAKAAPPPGTVIVGCGPDGPVLVPIEELGGVVPGEPGTVAVPVAPTDSVAEVLSRTPSRLVVGLGEVDGLARHDHVEVFVPEPVDLGGGRTSVRERLVAVGLVTAVSEDRSEVRLGLNERVPEGVKARRSERPLTASRFAPPRLGEVWEASVSLRPFLGLGTFGFGTLSDLQVVYRFSGPAALRLLVEPLGVGLSDEGNTVSLAADLVATWDTDLFEVGLGLGGSAVNSGLGEDSVQLSEAKAIEPEFHRVDTGLSITQLARLGALDGFHIQVHNSFILHKSQFEYGGTVASLQLPVSGKAWLVGRGGAGTAGFSFGELGLRVLVKGQGDRGSIFVTPVLGGAALWGEKDGTCQVYDWEEDQETEVPCVESVNIGGPMVGVTTEWRL